MRCFIALALLALMSSCVAAIGNSVSGVPQSAEPIVERKVESARRIVDLREQQLANLQRLHEAGRADIDVVTTAQIALEEARIALFQYEAELMAIRENDD